MQLIIHRRPLKENRIQPLLQILPIQYAKRLSTIVRNIANNKSLIIVLVVSAISVLNVLFMVQEI